MGEVRAVAPPQVSAAVGRLRGAARYVAAWSPLVVVYALLVGASDRLPTSLAILIALQAIGAAAVFGLGVRWYLRRDPWPGHMDAAFLARHAGGALLYSIAWMAFLLGTMRLDATSWRAVFQAAAPWLGWQLFFGVALYVVMASIEWVGVSMLMARETEARRVQADALRARAELEALRGRLDPHFLFNTLHSLSVLARHDAVQTQVALGQLADLLRYVLDSKRGAREQVPLAEELAFVRAYLALEGLRYGDRLRITTTVDEDALEHVVPSLSLQPLVENAIRHAVAPRAAGGSVSLSARLEDETLVLAVRDDGPGSPSNGTADTTGTGVGLDALRRRVALIYGSRAALETVATGAGFSVTLRLPA